MIQAVCAACGKKLRASDEHAGKTAKCPQCGQTLRIPDAEGLIPFSEPAPEPPTAKPASGNTIFCTKCGLQQPENSYQCVRCGFVLHGPTPTAFAATDENTLGGLIPYKNAKALWAYYLGVFALIPCIGIPLGVASLVLGIQGVKFANAHPEAKGKVHAWVGIILGAVIVLAHSVLAVSIYFS